MLCEWMNAVGWNYVQMGSGRKIDPEPGRCRRTDGKKWRCSKEAYPDSKYCERHMHRGKNRSRKPVEVLKTTTITTALNSNPSSSSSLTHNSTHSFASLTNSETHPHPHPFPYQHASASSAHSSLLPDYRFVQKKNASFWFWDTLFLRLNWGFFFFF